MNTHLTRWKGLALAVIALPLLAACGQTRPAPQMAAVEEPAWSPPPLAEEAGELPEAREVARRAIDFMQSHDRLGFEVIGSPDGSDEEVET